jgi:hypothetical protein
MVKVKYVTWSRKNECRSEAIPFQPEGYLNKDSWIYRLGETHVDGSTCIGLVNFSFQTSTHYPNRWYCTFAAVDCLLNRLVVRRRDRKTRTYTILEGIEKGCWFASLIYGRGSPFRPELTGTQCSCFPRFLCTRLNQLRNWIARHSNGKWI